MRYLLLIFLGISQLGFSQKSIEGTWKQENGETITFLSLGKLNTGYLLIDGTQVYWAKIKGNSISFVGRYNENKVFSNIKVNGDILNYTDPYSRYISAKKHSYNLPSLNMKNIPPDTNSFFDFSTNKYYAGDYFDLTAKGPLPFYINRLFIIKKKIDSISILLTQKVIEDSVVISEKVAGKCFFYFNSGFISKLMIIYDNPKTHFDTISWNYHYSKQNKLDSITIPGGILKFDKDEWVMDEFGHKVWNKSERPTFWEYKNGLPYKALKTFGGNFERKNRFFIFDEFNKLIEIKEKIEGVDNSFYLGYFIEYDEKGIPIKISYVRYW